MGEYIRGRRLTLAGSELVSSNVKVIDIAYKYGYESPESFTRAFIKFHGITPSQAKTCQYQLKSFSKLVVKLTLEGGTIMNYRIEKKEAFQIIEKARRFCTKDDSHTQEIPKFWDESQKDRTIKKLCQYCEGTDFDHCILGVCYENQNSKQEFTYSLATGYNGKEILPDLTTHQIEENTWAIFECRGTMPGAIQKMWKRIYSEFFPTSEYVAKGEIDFEVYPEGDMNSPDYVCEIWIAVEKR